MNLRLRGRALERPAWTTSHKEIGHFVDFLERRGEMDRPRAQALADDIVAGMLLEIGDHYVSAMQVHMDGIGRIRGELATRYEGIIRHFEGRSGAVPIELPPDLRPAAFKALFDELSTHLEALNTTAEAFTAKSLDTPAILSDLEGLRQTRPTEPPSGEGVAGGQGPGGPSGGPPRAPGPPGPPDLPRTAQDLRRARDKLGQIVRNYGEVFEDDLALRGRFEEIANLARTNPAESARLATDLELELAARTGREVEAVAVPEPAGGGGEELVATGQAGLRPTPGRAPPLAAEAGIFTHTNAEALRTTLDPPRIPKQFDADVTAGDIIPLSQLPDGLLAEQPLGVTSRVDRITPTTIADNASRIIYEIKPDNAKSIADGLNRGREYSTLANSQAQARGERADWRTIVVVYNRRAARKLIRQPPTAP